MKLTARQALEIGLELWEWLRENPVMWKREWPRWKEYWRMLVDCPLCEYDFQNCPKCLIYWRKKPGLFNHCQAFDSPYAKWARAKTPRSCRFYAGKIVKLHREALERLVDKGEILA